MWKKIRYVLYFTILISVFSVTYNFREYFYVPFIQKSINKISDSKVKFRNFSIKFPFKLILYDIRYDDKIFIDEAVLRFEPLIFFQNMKTPLKSLAALRINKVVLLDEKLQTFSQTSSQTSQQKDRFKKFKINLYKRIFDLFNLKCDINKADVLYDKKIVKFKNVSIVLNKDFDIGAQIRYLNHIFHIKGSVKLENELLTSVFYARTDGLVKTEFDLAGNYDLIDKSFEYNADIKDLYVNRLVLGNLKTNIKKDTSSLTINSSGKKLKLFFTSDMSDVWFSSGTINLRDVNDVLNTKLEYHTSKKSNDVDFRVAAKNTKVFGYDAGDFNFEISNDDEIYNILCYHDSGNSFKTVVEKNGDYKTDVFNRKIKIGEMSGNYRKGEVRIDIKDIPVTKLPFMNNLNKTVKGTVSLYGNIGATEGTIFLKGRQIASKHLKGFDVSGKLYKQNYKWMSDIATKDKKIVMNGFYETKRSNGIDIFYNGVDSNNLLQILGIKNPQLSGKVTGSVKYSASDFVTYVDMNLKNGSLFGNKFDDWTISSNVSKTQLNISTFTFKGKNSGINIKSSINFSKKEPESYFNCLIENFKIKNVAFNYDLVFTGKLSDNNEIYGDIKVDKLSLGDFNFSHTASMLISTKKVHIENFDNDNGFSGELSYDYYTKNISGFLKNTKSKLSQHYPHIKGRLSSKLKISGKIDNPEMSFDGKIKNALYNNVLFDTVMSLKYEDKKINLKKLQISSGDKAEMKFNASGILDKKSTNVKVDFKGVSEDIINKYVGFRTPFKGTFYGNGKIAGALSELKAVLNLYADTIFIKSMKFNSFSSKVKVNDKNIAVENAKIKISDSEIKIASATFNTKTGKYDSYLKFVNTHLGPFDVFGSVKIDGKMTKKRGGSTYNGNIGLTNLWLNDERIDSLSLKYVINNRNFNFKTGDKNPLNVSGNINFAQYPKVILKNISISRLKQIYKLNGFVVSDNADLTMNGKNIDLGVMAGLFGFPDDMTGALDFNLKSSGSISNPAINLSLNSSNGTIYHVPFDLCDIKIDVKNNNLNIDKFSVKKNGKYELIVDGYFPFWLDSALTDKMMKRKVNVNYKLNDNSLYILNNITEKSVTSKKGSLKINGKLSGIRKNISNVGKMSLNGTNIKTDSYINKIKELSLDVVWNNNLFKIEKGSAKIGSGVLESSGTVKMQGINPSFYDLNFFTSKKGVPVNIKELPIPTSGVFKMESSSFANFSKGVPTFNFKLYGKAKNVSLTGWAQLENTIFCFPSPIKSRYKDVPFFISNLLDNLYIDIDLKTASNTRYENSFISMLLRGSINIKGKVDDLSVNGVVISDDGLFSYLGNDFEIINSKIEIINNELFITGEGESEVYSAGDNTAEVIKVYIDRSDINNIKTRFASKNDPTMDSKKALARLTKTDPSQTSTLETSTDFLVKQQAIRMFGSNIATPLANTVLKKTGIVDNVRLGFVNQDTLQISSDEEATMAELLYGMKYSVEKNINRLLQIGYSVTFDKVQREIDLKQAVEMSLKLNRNLFLKGSYGLQSDNPDYEPEKRFMIEQRLRF